MTINDVEPDAATAGVPGDNAIIGSIGFTVRNLVNTCGLGRTLHLGAANGAAVEQLLSMGIDAHGFSAGKVEISADDCVAERIASGNATVLPFQDDSFDTVLVHDFFEHLPVSARVAALSEIYRISRKNVYLDLALAGLPATAGESATAVRASWEMLCFEAGFRKHSAYYRINDYEALNRESGHIVILLEKISAAALTRYPMSCLIEERGLHMDMMRDPGERSDAHVVRYHWACRYVKPGDRVLDAACGLGYGGHLIRQQTLAATVTGIDGSDFAVDYANACFPVDGGTPGYICGMLPEALAQFADGSFDTIISFETLEHVEDPRALLAEFDRVLSPGGRIIVSVPNDWSDETGTDPNPYHLHVYDWARLLQELGHHFIPDEAYAQTASQCKVAGQRHVWKRSSRRLHQVDWNTAELPECEWWLMVGMKSPLAQGSYEERVFANLVPSGHASVAYAQDYQYPWLMHAMVNTGYRLKNRHELDQLARLVMERTSASSNDYKAALCVLAYGVLSKNKLVRRDVDGLLELLRTVNAQPDTAPMALRWKVSLTYVMGKLLQKAGLLSEAKAAFVECAQHDVRPFGVHLATKTTEAWYLAGKLAYALGDREEARRLWGEGRDAGNLLLSVSLNDILISHDFPNRFNHGDGLREYTLAWDNLARCVNGLHLLQLNRDIDFPSLDSCHHTEYEGVTADLIATRATLVERTLRLEDIGQDIEMRTRDLVETRSILLERSNILDRTVNELHERTEDLVNTRQVLVERTVLLENVSERLDQCTAELIDTRQELERRTILLEKCPADSLQCMAELASSHQELESRTLMLERISGDLVQRTAELVDTRKVVEDRTLLLEALTEKNIAEQHELNQLRQSNERLQEVLHQKTLQMDELQAVLTERTGTLHQVTADLASQYAELQRAKLDLTERTRELNEFLSIPFYKRFFLKWKK